MTGASNTSSSAIITEGGRADDEDRINRRSALSASSERRRARVRIAWCMVGTAVYHVAPDDVSQSMNLNALNPGEQITVPPADSDASNAAAMPCM